MQPLGPDAKGRYRCGYRCHPPLSDDNLWPEPKWKTLKGVQKHMDECPLKPQPEWVPPPRPEPVFWGDCPRCGDAIFEGETIWEIDRGADPRRWVCHRCCLHPKCPPGFLSCAGLFLPGLEDFRA